MMDARNTSTEIATRRPEVAVFGIGAVEQHSIHLPLGTDWLGVEDISRRVATELDAFLVPSLPFSMSQCHGPMPGTVWLRPITLAKVVRDVVTSLRAQGIRKILIINGHGGNFVLEAEVRQLNQQARDLTVLLAMLMLAPDPDEPGVPAVEPGIHACEGETSHQLYINPDHVRAERVDYLPPVGREFLDYAFMSSISEWGVWGTPSRASAAQGKRASERFVANTCSWARETFARVDALRRSSRES